MVSKSSTHATNPGWARDRGDADQKLKREEKIAARRTKVKQPQPPTEEQVNDDGIDWTDTKWDARWDD